jgi:hypothetical protein
MDFSAHAGAVLGYFPFIVAIPAGIAVVCNHIDGAKRHPKVVYTECGLLSLGIAFLLSRLPGTAFRGVNLGVAGVLAALCFVVAYLRATDILTKKLRHSFGARSFSYLSPPLISTSPGRTGRVGAISSWRCCAPRLQCFYGVHHVWLSTHSTSRLSFWQETLWSSANTTTYTIQQCAKTRSSSKSSVG